MGSRRAILWLALAVVPAAALLGAGAAPHWRALPGLPDPEGFAGSFAGVSGGVLLAAGGANFPGRKPWEGGAKVWHDEVFALDRPDGAWRLAGRLPGPLGYGVFATHGGGVVCVGGSDAARHHRDAFRLVLRSGGLERRVLPPLPDPLANGCGALVGEMLYVGGGQTTPTGEAVATVHRLRLDREEARWERLPDLPGGGRILATAAAVGREFWVMGGAALEPGVAGAWTRRYLRDAWRWEPGRGWERLPDLPRPVVAAPSPAPVENGSPLLIGGDDGSRLGVAPERHPGFDGRVLRFDRRRAAWVEAGAAPAPRVTVPCVRWGDWWVLPSGEARPGVRSPQVWALRRGG
jgi:N-acetylneuraminate epimerase